MKEHISPEEKLLRLIKNPKKPLEAKAVVKVPEKAASSLSIQKIAVIVFIASCAYLLAVFIYPLIKSEESIAPEVSDSKIMEPEQPLLDSKDKKPYEFYQEAVKGRQIFSAPASLGKVLPEASVVNSAELVKDLNLVGVVSGDNPQAVIEDKKTKKTYYINKGQFIGQFRASDIEEGKVTLDSNGQKFELYL